MQIEIQWKQISDYPDYEVSNTGLVRSKKSIYLDGLRQQVYRNYLCVRLYDEQGKSSWQKVHRLVALHFVDNPQGKPQVNHLDYNTFNNHDYNLEWVTVKENVAHSKHRMGFNRMTVLQLDPKTREVLNTFESCQAAVVAMGGKNNGGAVAHAVRHQTKSYGFYWESSETS